MKNQELIKNSAECALKFLEEYSYTENMTCAYKAFKALAELTLKDLDAGASVEECRYDPFYIAQQMGENYVKETKEKTINNAKNYLKKLMGAIAGHNDTFKKIADKNNFSVIPSVKYIEGGGNGNPNSYYIDYEELVFSKNMENQGNIDTGDLPEECIDSNDSPKNNVNYFVERIKFNTVMNWIYNHELSDFVMKFEITNVFLVLTMTLFFGFYSIQIIFYADYSLLDFYMIPIYVVLVFFFQQEWRCINKRIIPIMPLPEVPKRIYATQLECIATDEIRESTGNPIRRIQLVSYWATCPICKNKLQRNVRIDVENGGREFHHRLIGRCSESPTEHIYSFDRVTRIGKPLR